MPRAGTVVVADRDPALVGRSVICDVSDEAAVAALIDGIRTTETRLDALICNAGFGIHKPIADLSLAEWSSVLATNLTSIFLLVRAAELLLRKANGCGPHHRLHPRAHVGTEYRGLRRFQRRHHLADPRAGHQPRSRRASELHQSRLDLAPKAPNRRRRSTHSIPPAASARPRTSPPWRRFCSAPTAASSPARSSPSMAGSPAK